MDGGAGTDTVDYSAAATAITADLNGGSGSAGDALGDSYIAIENLTGTIYSDTLQGNAGSNVLTGGDGDDNLLGLGGNDTIVGGNGNDRISGGAGADALDGGAGSNLLFFGTSPNFPESVSVTTGITINLDGTTLGIGGDAAGDTYRNFQTIYLTNQADSVTGTAAAEWFRGLGGADTINGGDGIDTVSYLGSSGVTIGLDGAAGSGGEAQGDRLSNIETLQGSDQDDLLWGNSGANTVYGMAGNDTLRGDAGADWLDGGSGGDTVSYVLAGAAVTASLLSGGGSVGDAAGYTYVSIEGLAGSNFNDTLHGDSNSNSLSGGSGDDFLRGGGGADTLSGGGGFDTADYSDSTAAVSVLLDGTAANGGFAQGDVLTSIEAIVGSSFNDTLVGSNSAETLTGGDGNDTLGGFVGDDTLLGGNGNDTMTGGTGADTADGGADTDSFSYAASTGGVTAYLDGTVGAGNEATGDRLSNIEILIGSGFDDTLFGTGGAETLQGGNGNDALVGGAGADMLDGGAGTDSASFANAGSAINASFATGALVVTASDAVGDTYISIEGVVGSAFADTLRGGAGIELLDGGLGDDTLYGSTSADTLIGGGGFDTVDFSASSTAITARLDGTASSGGDAAGDTLNGIEQVIGTSLADTFFGSAADETFRGGDGADSMTGAAGNDTLFGEAGNDLLNGGLGSDALDGGAGTDTATYANSALGVAANLFDSAFNTNEAAGDSYTSVENLVGSAFNDRLTGDDGNNNIDGGTGDDRLSGGVGADTLIGGTGTDTADYGTASSAVGLTLGAGGTGTLGAAAGDSLSGIERIIGSAFGDQFTLAPRNGWTIDGGAGADSVRFDSGSIGNADLTGVLSKIEDIDFTAAGVNATLTMDAATIQSLVGAGNSSSLTLHVNGDDSVAIANGAFYTQSGGDYVFYTDNTLATEAARLTVGA
ncbi:calcium-binding protein [Novosphingobium sp. Chol11]|uniref:beta strand repeat-containing protein n=1 Tax=Novosphingobium sp. Chol11 TaxID=1385763 RepID=UPI0025E4F638|nr:calcium-binding protein [Novosphingobium sp. Chol11]